MISGYPRRVPDGEVFTYRENTMGLFRKMTSLSTMGAVDFRSDKERGAAYAKATKRQSKKQTRQLRKQTKLIRKAGR